MAAYLFGKEARSLSLTSHRYIRQSLHINQSSLCRHKLDKFYWRTRFHARGLASLKESTERKLQKFSNSSTHTNASKKSSSKTTNDRADGDPAEEEPPPWSHTLLSAGYGFAFFALNATLVAHLWATYVFDAFSMPEGPSMLPTLNLKGDGIIISKLHRRGRWVKNGDIVTFEHPIRPGQRALKRVIGMPGDLVARDTPGQGEGWLVRVPDGHCWVAGDNTDWSRDSRHFGPLPLALIRGRVVCRWWPFSELRWFGDPYTTVLEAVTP